MLVLPHLANADWELRFLLDKTANELSGYDTDTKSSLRSFTKLANWDSKCKFTNRPKCEHTLEQSYSGMYNIFQHEIHGIKPYSISKPPMMEIEGLLWMFYGGLPSPQDFTALQKSGHASSVIASATGIDPDEVLGAGDMASTCAGLIIIDASEIICLVNFSA